MVSVQSQDEEIFVEGLVDNSLNDEYYIGYSDTVSVLFFCILLNLLFFKIKLNKNLKFELSLYINFKSNIFSLKIFKDFPNFAHFIVVLTIL